MVRHTLAHGGLTRDYELQLPAGYRSDRRWPLLVTLHGGGSNALHHLAMTGLAEVCLHSGIVLAAPNGVGYLDDVNTWNAVTCCGYARDHLIDDVGFLGELISHLARRYALDAKRLHVCGFSNGAMLAYAYAVNNLRPVAGVIGVGGTIPRDLLSRGPLQRPRILHIHGWQDPCSKWEGGRSPNVTDSFDGVSVGDHVAYWSDVEAGQLSAADTTPEALVVDFPGLKGGGALRLVGLPASGHTWPGGQRPQAAYFSAGRLLWRPWTEAEVGPLVATWSASEAIAKWVKG